MPLDPAHWSWGKLGVATATWAVALTVVAGWLVARAMAHAKQSDPGGGDFVTTLPYGTRHLTIYMVLLLLPALIALARKLTAG